MTGKIDYEKYIDSNGLLSGDGSTSGNGVLYTSELMILHRELELPMPIELAGAIARCVIEPGFLKRSLTNGDRESFDDYVGYCAASPSWAKDVLSYAEKHFWVFNNVEPGKFNWKSWLGRSPAFRAHVKFCAGQTPGPIEFLSWCFSVITAGGSHQDSWILTALMCLGARQKNWLMRASAAIFQWKLEFKYGTLGYIFGLYFNNRAHPLAFNWDRMDYHEDIIRP